MADPTGSTPPKEPTSPKLLRFLADFERLIDAYAVTVKGVVSDPDSAAVIDSLSAVAKLQAQSLGKFVGNSYGQSSPILRSQVDEFFERLGGEELMRTALAVTPKVTSVQALIGISDIITLIKKIIMFILGLLFPKGIPDWITQLIEIIDEFIHAILGQRSHSAQRAANQNHMDFLESMRILRQFQLLENGNGQEDSR
jgi:hypothetical protein